MPPSWTRTIVTWRSRRPTLRSTWYPLSNIQPKKRPFFGIPRVGRRLLDVGTTSEHKSRMKTAPPSSTMNTNASSPKGDNKCVRFFVKSKRQDNTSSPEEMRFSTATLYHFQKWRGLFRGIEHTELRPCDQSCYVPRFSPLRWVLSHRLIATYHRNVQSTGDISTGQRYPRSPVRRL